MDRAADRQPLARVRAVGSRARKLVARISLVVLDHEELQRAFEPFPVPVRTLDALHLATMDFLREQGQELRLATYDERLWRAAEALDFEAFPV